MSEENQNLETKGKDELEISKLKEEIFALQSEKDHRKKQDEVLSKKEKTETFKFYFSLFVPLIFACITPFIVDTLSSKRVAKAETESMISKLVVAYAVAEKEAQQINIACEIKSILDSCDNRLLKHEYNRFIRLCVSTQQKEAERNSINNIAKSNSLETKELFLEKADSIDIAQQKLTKQLSSGAISAEQKKKINQSLVELNNLEKNVRIQLTGADTSLGQKITLIAKSEIQTKDSVDNEKDVDVFWFKPGYYLQFNEISISLQSINESEDYIIFSVYEGEEDHKLQSDIKLQYGKTHSFADSKGQEHRLTLKKIGPAGKNPFKPAAYITFT
jgi:hypothetical protein